MKYYKVVNSCNGLITIDTEHINYSMTLNNYNSYEELLKLIASSSHKDDLPLDMYVNLNNNLVSFAEYSNVYVQQFPKPENGMIEVFGFSHKDHHKNLFIKEQRLAEYIQNINDKKPLLFTEGFYLWEYIYEEVRALNHPDKPKRSNSFFLFETIQDCNYYIEKHKGGGTICEVELNEIKNIFKADMNIFDSIGLHNTFNESAKSAEDYWLGKTSENPVFEIIFQGKCTLAPMN